MQVMIAVMNTSRAVVNFFSGFNFTTAQAVFITVTRQDKYMIPYIHKLRSVFQTECSSLDNLNPNLVNNGFITTRKLQHDSTYN